MKKALKIAFFAILVTAAQAFASEAHAAPLTVEGEQTTNPWFVDNSVYCVNPTDNCLSKSSAVDSDTLTARKSRLAPDESNKPVFAQTQSVSYDVETTPSEKLTTPTTENLDASLLFSLVNDYRAQNGLAAFKEEDRICKIASDRAPELYNEIFGTGYMHQGFRERNLQYWATENMIYEFSEVAALNWWKNSWIHNSALLGDYEYSCVRCQGNTCAEIFTNFSPKSI